MKKFAIISVSLLLALSACSSCSSCSSGQGKGVSEESPAPFLPSAGSALPSSASAAQADVKDNYVEVLYFHGKQRCVTCRAIEAGAKEALESTFPDRLEDGSVVFRTIDISKEENEAIAGKYEVVWSSLIVVRHSGDKETAENMTEFAFANARNSPDVFKAGVVKAVNDGLK